MIKILIGGSPCTFWSIAQKNGRETEPNGLGWELFKNYLIAKEKFKPDLFLYENNKSASQAIKDEISKDLGVDLMYINSALVSAQNRQRFYCFNWQVEQPKDRGIILKDILESGEPFGVTKDGKALCVRARYGGATPKHTLEKSFSSMVAEPVRIPPYKKNETARPLNANYSNNAGLSIEKRIFSDNPKKQQIDYIAQPVKVGILPNAKGEMKDAQATRIYSVDGKSVNLVANGGGQGAKTGLYAVPYELSTEYYKGGQNSSLIGMTANGEDKYRNGSQPSQQYRVYSCEGKSQVINTLGNENYIVPTGNKKQILAYEVKNGLITIKGEQYPINLADGFYIIRKLTVKECCRLQTLPDDYCKAVSKSQAYKGLGNGWTAEVIIHILNGALKDVSRNEEIIVLSMYDGIGTGRYCLEKMGFKNIKYFAYEIDKFAKQVANDNFPDIKQMGDAFDVRNPDWTIGY